MSTASEQQCVLPDVGSDRSKLKKTDLECLKKKVASLKDAIRTVQLETPVCALTRVGIEGLISSLAASPQKVSSFNDFIARLTMDVAGKELHVTGVVIGQSISFVTDNTTVPWTLRINGVLIKDKPATGGYNYSRNLIPAAPLIEGRATELANKEIRMPGTVVPVNAYEPLLAAPLPKSNLPSAFDRANAATHVGSNGEKYLGAFPNREAAERALRNTFAARQFIFITDATMGQLANTAWTLGKDLRSALARERAMAGTHGTWAHTLIMKPGVIQLLSEAPKVPFVLSVTPDVASQTIYLTRVNTGRRVVIMVPEGNTVPFSVVLNGVSLGETKSEIDVTNTHDPRLCKWVDAARYDNTKFVPLPTSVRMQDPASAQWRVLLAGVSDPESVIHLVGLDKGRTTQLITVGPLARAGAVFVNGEAVAVEATSHTVPTNALVPQHATATMGSSGVIINAPTIPSGGDLVPMLLFLEISSSGSGAMLQVNNLLVDRVVRIFPTKDRSFRVKFNNKPVENAEGELTGNQTLTCTTFMRASLHVKLSTFNDYSTDILSMQSVQMPDEIKADRHKGVVFEVFVDVDINTHASLPISNLDKGRTIRIHTTNKTRQDPYKWYLQLNGVQVGQFNRTRLGAYVINPFTDIPKGGMEFKNDFFKTPLHSVTPNPGGCCMQVSAEVLAKAVAAAKTAGVPGWEGKTACTSSEASNCPTNTGLVNQSLRFTEKGFWEVCWDMNVIFRESPVFEGQQPIALAADGTTPLYYFIIDPSFYQRVDRASKAIAIQNIEGTEKKHKSLEWGEKSDYRVDNDANPGQELAVNIRDSMKIGKIFSLQVGAQPLVIRYESLVHDFRAGRLLNVPVGKHSVVYDGADLTIITDDVWVVESKDLNKKPPTFAHPLPSGKRRVILLMDMEAVAAGGNTQFTFALSEDPGFKVLFSANDDASVKFNDPIKGIEGREFVAVKKYKAPVEVQA